MKHVPTCLFCSLSTQGLPFVWSPRFSVVKHSLGKDTCDRTTTLPFTMSREYRLTLPELTQQLSRSHPKTKLVFQALFLRCHVSFRWYNRVAQNSMPQVKAAQINIGLNELESYPARLIISWCLPFQKYWPACHPSAQSLSHFLSLFFSFSLFVDLPSFVFYFSVFCFYLSLKFLILFLFLFYIQCPLPAEAWNPCWWVCNYGSLSRVQVYMCSLRYLDTPLF